MRNLRTLLLAGAARLILTADDENPDGGAGGAPAVAPDPAAAAADPAPEPDPAAGGGEGGAPAPAADPEPSKPPRVPWQTKRIDELTAKTRAAEEERERIRKEAEQTNAALQRYKAMYGDLDSGAAVPADPAPAPQPGGKVYTEEDVRKEAARLASMNALNQRCDAMFDTGAKTYGDAWKTRINAVGQAFGPDLAKRVDFFDAITALDNPADVYNELAGDLDHFAEVLEMSPTRMGIELAKLSTAASARPKVRVSSAPAPIEPLDSAGAGGDADPMKDMNAYAADFERRKVERIKARGAF